MVALAMRTTAEVVVVVEKWLTDFDYGPASDGSIELYFSFAPKMLTT